MTINIDSRGNIQPNWNRTPIFGIYGRKNSGKTVFAEGLVATNFKRTKEGIKNITGVKCIDIWNPMSIGRFEGVYPSFPAKEPFATIRRNNGLDVFGIPTKIIIPNSMEVPHSLPANPRFLEEPSDEIKGVDLDFQVVTIPFKHLTGAELCLRYGRRETELTIGIVDRVINAMKPDESTIDLAKELFSFLKGKSRKVFTEFKSKVFQDFLTKEVADFRSRRGVVALIKPLIEERMLSSEKFSHNLDWKEEIEDLDRITVLYQGFLDYGSALMVTFFSIRKIVETCIETGNKAVFLIREISDIAPAFPNPLFPQQFFGSLLMEMIARQLRERVALVYDTQRPHLLIDSLKTQADVSVFFQLQGEDIRAMNQLLNPVTGIDFSVGTNKYPPINRLRTGQCYVWDSNTMKLFFVRRVFMPPHRHWSGERNFLEYWKMRKYPMKSCEHIMEEIQEEMFKADQELYEQEKKAKELTPEEAKIKAEIEVEKEAQERYVLKLNDSINPNTGEYYTLLEIAELVGITDWNVRKILAKHKVRE